MSVIDTVRGLVAPILTDLGLDLYDLDYAGGVVKVVVDRAGGADLDLIALATRLISRELDHADPIPGRYTLEVSSPGLERTLRTPAHFQAAVGRVVAIRTLAHVEGERRVQGALLEADADGIIIAVSGSAVAPSGTLGSDGRRRLGYTDIDRARTVFEWGGEPKPGTPGAKRAPGKAAGSTPPTRAIRRAASRAAAGADPTPAADAAEPSRAAEDVGTARPKEAS